MTAITARQYRLLCEAAAALGVDPRDPDLGITPGMDLELAEMPLEAMEDAAAGQQARVDDALAKIMDAAESVGTSLHPERWAGHHRLLAEEFVKQIESGAAS